jgi:long-subunit acyl-CoA synthetase (AMP-forming)
MADTAERSGAAVLEPLGHLGPGATLVQAFQATAAERPDQVALRTSDGAVSLTWAQCAERVRRLAGGLAGQPLRGVELRIAEDGEVLAKGPQVMRGYRGRPDLTAETIIDGWLHTGDIGRIDADGYLSIVDRKKELIINAAGKNMSPLAIELALKTAGPLIGQACAIGDRRPYTVALLVLDPDGARAWAAAHGRPDADYAALTADPDLLADVGAEVALANTELSRVEQIKYWRLLPADWLPDGDELTPTMKMRRRVIGSKYAATIEELYA